MSGLPLRAAKTATIATAASRMIEMMSIGRELVDHGSTFHRNGGIRQGRSTSHTCCLGSADDRLYPFDHRQRGELQNVEIDLGVRVGYVDVRAGPCGRHGLRTPPVLSSAVLSPARAARHRGRAAALERQFHHQWRAVYGTISVLLPMGRRRAYQASGW